VAGQLLTGKVAIVTGAGSPIGLGRAMALALVQAGARVALLDVNEEVLSQTATELRQLGGEHCVLPVVADVSQPGDAERGVQEALEEFGSLHVLVNNAGISLHHAGVKGDPEFWDVPTDAWLRVLSVNAFGPFLMARAAVKPMLQQRWGRIIGVTTSLDTMWRRRNPAYGSSKAAHEAFVASIAQALEGTGVTANVLVPGGTANTNLLPPESSRDRGQMLQPEVMQAPVVWLASEASSGFTGQRIIAQRWDDRVPLADRLAQASAPAAWPGLGRHTIHASRAQSSGGAGTHERSLK
jgi:NAD(P)-dependent dehydrogenase (short-subunit alcohol dehydrogenase family)